MNWVVLSMQLFPYVLQSVMVVQQALQGQSGATKKAVVMSAVQAGAQLGGVTGGSHDDHEKAVSALVDSTVATLNQTGVFNTGVPTKQQ